METTQNKATDQSSGRPYRLGVALSGGGARGLAHAGALMAIEEAGLCPDVIAGVSAGSVVAVLYAAGCKPIEIASIFSERGFRDFAEFKLGGGGLFVIKRFEKFILSHLKGARKMEDLKIPTYIGATDFDNGRPAIFHKGPIGPRMVASCSIPIVFTPVNIDGTNYVDGGVLRNMPAWIIRDKCDLLIGINVSPLRDYDTSSVIGAAMRTYNLMAKANQAEDMAICDVAVETSEIASYKVFDLSHIHKVFVSGYLSTRRALRQAGLWNPDKNKDTGCISDLTPPMADQL
ncbi:MAG: patatin-like phospholipase family protein [Muribaculaceae bacterium]|nr:patatin-like phospholipase family protein [Muribaculaceae bacterium]